MHDLQAHEPTQTHGCDGSRCCRCDGMAFYRTAIQSPQSRFAQGRHRIRFLMRAAAKADMAAVQEILHQGIDVNAQDDFGSSALMEAAFGGHGELVQFLLDGGADVSVMDAYGNTALHLASLKHHTEVITRLTYADDACAHRSAAYHSAIRPPEQE